jgi:hypothetical protein
VGVGCTEKPLEHRRRSALFMPLSHHLTSRVTFIPYSAL